MARTTQLRSRTTWGGAIPRMYPEVWPMISPGFKVSPGATIFTIGSCFARNVEKNLATLRFHLPTLEMRLPEDEWRQGDNAFLNRYTPQTIAQDIAWTAAQLDTGFDPDRSAPFGITLDDGRMVDTGIPGFVPVNPERFIERRRALFDLNCQAFSAECVTITLGLVEGWRDTVTGAWLHSTPLGRTMMQFGDRFVPEQGDYPEAFHDVDQSVRLLREHNPDVKILLTTSPVGMLRTFSEDDVITANLYSKSVLRAVAGRVAQLHEMTDYFPSFESAMLTRNWDIWDQDRLHLGKAFIAKIVTHLVSYYFEETDASAVLHQKSYQLYLERDYAAAGDAIAEALSLAPDDVALLRHAADVAQARREEAAAVAYLERAVELAPTDPLWLAVGMARNRAGDREGAEAAYRIVLERDPEHLVARFQLSRMLLVRGERDEAACQLRLVVEADPSRWAAWLSYAQIALDTGDPQAAIERASAALPLLPPKHRDKARSLLGLAHLAQDDLDTARFYAGDAETPSRFLRPLQLALEAHDAAANPSAAA